MHVGPLSWLQKPTVTLDVAAAVAELRTDLILFGPLLAGEPGEATVWIWNSGDGAAADVVTTVDAPAGWAFAPPSGAEPGRACSVTLDATSVTCTYDSIAPGTRRDIDLLLREDRCCREAWRNERQNHANERA